MKSVIELCFWFFDLRFLVLELKKSWSWTSESWQQVWHRKTRSYSVWPSAHQLQTRSS